MQSLPPKALRLTATVFTAAALACATAGLHAQQLTLLGLRTQNHAGAFRGLKADAAGNLYTLFAAGDGVRVLKFDATGTQLLAQVQIGQAGDAGVALDVDAAGDVYVAGTSLSNGSVTGTAGTAFPNRSGTSTNSFVAKFSPALVEQWLTFCGSAATSASAIAVSVNSVLVTGSTFLSAIPVTPGGIQQSPAPNSSGNGFVESFSVAGGTLTYATYLTGANGTTAPTAIAVDTSGNAYVAGNTSATGYPTSAALVPVFRAVAGSGVSGFVTKLTAAGDGFLFSTFVPGGGITSVALDGSGAGSLLLAGNVAPGLFPLTQAQAAIAPLLSYQSAVRLALDGSSVLSSTLLAPGTESVIAPDGSGGAWVYGSQQNSPAPPLLPVLPVEPFGNAFALRVPASGRVDRAARFGGLPTANSGFASLPATEGGVVIAADGSVSLAGAVAPTLSSGLLATQTYDLPLVAAPNAALTNTVRDALPLASCSGSACAGGAGMLARLLPDASAPTLALSFDDLPNVTLRNVGTASATGVQVTASGYTVSSGCAGTLAAGAECPLLLAGAGPGSITVQATGAASFTTQLPANTGTAAAVAVLPRELDFGIQASASAAATRTLTVFNIGTSAQTFTSQNATTFATGYTLSQTASTCTATGSGSLMLAAGGSCTITLSLTASSDATNDGGITARWQVGASDVLVTGYAQAAAVSLSSTTVDFGRQYLLGLRAPRFLYLSNSSDTPQSHAAVASTNAAFTVTDECPATLQPRSVCRIALGYSAASAPSSDALTLMVDGLTATLLGETLPQPSLGGASTNPNLTVTPTVVSYSNLVTATTASAETYNVTIGNTGVQPFTLVLSIAGDFTFTSGCPATLNGGGVCTAKITFTPTAAGLRQGLLSVAAGSATPVYVELSGTGTAILPVNNGINFGDVPVMSPTVQWLKISQTLGTLSVASSDANFTTVLVEDAGYGHGTPAASAFARSSTGTCFNCYLGVQFLPTSTGAHTAVLSLSTPGGGQSEPLAVSGDGTPLTGLILTPVAQDYGPVPVHSSSASTVFQLTNGTAASISSTGAVTAGDFAVTAEATGGASCTAASVAPGASCFVPVRFAPTATGTRTGMLTVNTSAGSATSSLAGIGADDPGIALAPTALNFDNVSTSAATQQSLTITNTSTTPATVGTASVSDTHFSVSSGCGVLAAGASCTETVSYAAGSSLVDATLTIPVTTAPGGAPVTTPYTVALNGLYTAESAGIQIIPGTHTTVNFGAATTGAPAGSRVLHVNNVSGKPLTMSASAARQFAITSSTCAALPAGASCDVTVQYTPLTAGDTTGTVFLQGVPADNSATLSGLAYLEGYGNATSKLAVTGNISPSGVISFGQVTSGTTSSQTVTLTNPATAPAGTVVTVRRVTSGFPFNTATTCGLPLSPGQSCIVTVTYAPQYQLATGTVSPLPANDIGAVSIESDSSASPLFLDLSGSSNPVLVNAPNNTAPIVAFVTSQGALNFGLTAVGSQSPAQTVTITNTGTVPVHVLKLLTTSASFAATGSCATIAPGADCAVSVMFQPQIAGTNLASLEMETDASASLEFVSLLGSASPASVSLAPQSIDFGRVLVGGSGSQTATLTNTGAVPVTMGAVTVMGGDFAVATASSASNACPAAGATLNAGASCTVAVVFTPSTATTERATLSVATAATPLPLTVSLSGTGTQPQLVVTPTALSFGQVAVGSSATLSLTLNNTSALPVNGINFTATPAAFNVTSTCGVTALTAGSSCSVSVTYTPGTTGSATGTLTINSSDPASPITVPLTGSAVAGGNFILAVNGAPSASATVVQGAPATYVLTVTPTGGYAGIVALTCTADSAVQYAYCSIAPSSVTLTNSPQTATVTITTISTATSQMASTFRMQKRILMCCTPALLVLLCLRRKRVAGLLAVCLCVSLMSGGCGSSAPTSMIRYPDAGTYNFHVTAVSTNTIPVQQSVALSLTVTPQ